MRGLSTEGNLCFKINRASPIDGSKFTVFALFYFVFEGNFPSTSPRGAYIWRGDLTEGFLRYRFEGLIFGGVYTWRGLFSEFYGTFEPASLRIDRGGTGYKLKMSLFSCSAANTPHRFFLLDKNFYKQIPINSTNYLKRVLM